MFVLWVFGWIDYKYKEKKHFVIDEITKIGVVQ